MYIQATDLEFVSPVQGGWLVWVTQGHTTSFETLHPVMSH